MWARATLTTLESIAPMMAPSMTAMVTSHRLRGAGRSRPPTPGTGMASLDIVSARPHVVTSHLSAPDGRSRRPDDAPDAITYRPRCRVSTLTSAETPTGTWTLGSEAGSREIRTATSWTSLTKVPVALPGGRSAVGGPQAAVVP